MEDTFRHKGLRKKLVEVLINKGIKCNKVLNTINNIPRHLFIDNAFDKFSYLDKAFPIGNKQTISQPFTVAFQTELLKIKPHEKILEIGTGSGYQSAVLISLEADVYTIERQKELYLKTKDFLPKIGYKCNFFYGDGYKGLPNFAPYDKIIVTCGAPVLPKILISQLKMGGLMVAPIGRGEIQTMHLIEKIDENKISISKHGDFSFVPMLNNKQKK
tara:strand:+ start:28676 stop:29323 length:648 start_codon:yes stop_codon:yes gene_type:complete